MSGNLLAKTCTPCRGGIPPLSQSEAEAYLKEAPGWTLLDDGRRMTERAEGWPRARDERCRSARTVADRRRTAQRPAARLLLAAMMKSFSCKPLIFLVCHDTVAQPQPKLISG